jgi:hypothetical protein
MLSRVVVQSETQLNLELENARPDDPIVVDKIEGLDPPNIDLFTGDYARDGGYYSGRRVGKRNPVFYLTMNPNPGHINPAYHSVANIREQLYRAFIDPRAAGDDVRIDLIDDEKPARYLSGYTEKLESSIFSKDTDLVISMLCPNPYIYNVVETVDNVNGTTVPFPYEGTAETGVEVKLQLTSASSTVSVAVNGGVPMVMNYAFLTGDIIYINTRRGERKIQLTRGGSISSTGVISGGTTTNILYSQTQASRWLELHRVVPVPITNPNGLSTMKAYGASLTDTIANIKQIRSRGAWWGI